jgi:hypothetical protein
MIVVHKEGRPSLRSYSKTLRILIQGSKASPSTRSFVNAEASHWLSLSVTTFFLAYFFAEV